MSKATTYYISNAGNDINSGKTSDLPWQTINKVNAATFKAGDQILFQRGSTFYGSITVNQSGTSGNPITFGAYGSGANPVITGFTTVEGWTDFGNNIWESTKAVSKLSATNMVVINGVNTAMGRYPNADAEKGGFLRIDSSPSSVSITNSTLTGTPDWTDAELVIRSNDWTMEKRKIISQNGSTLTYSISCYPPKHYGFFIQNDPRTLDQQNEWYFNPTTKKIRIYSTSQPLDVKVASVENLLTFTHSVGYINLDGIDFTGANSIALYRTAFSTIPQKAHHINVMNCKILYSGQDAISVCAYTLNIENNTISESNRFAMLLSGSKDVVVRNNSVRNSGTLPGMGVPFTALMIDGPVAGSNTTSMLVEYNSIINTGHNAISIGADSTVIRYNFIDTFNTLLDDGAGIYGAHNSVITNNIVLNGIGAPNGKPWGPLTCGIYLDDNSSYNEIGYNTVYNCPWFGILLHNANNNKVHHNISFNNTVQFRTADDHLGASVTANLINYNQFIAMTTSQKVCDFNSQFENLLGIGTLDYNYYARPLAQTDIITTSQPSGNASRTLESWQKFSKQDANSQKSPQKIRSVADFRFEYNNTKTAKKVALSQPMIDITGAKYADTVTIEPYYSVVLMKDYTTLGATKLELNNNSIKCYPNLFSSHTTFQFTVEQPKNVILEIFNMSGNKVNQLINQHYSPGTYSFVWNGTNFKEEILSKGMYIYRFCADEYVSSQKLMIY
ncbi:MAG: right-handed parallel beta-helix repeat-containing protein [Prolixibacteraceae bacterium]|nr:right-handed parallel beta-helix repeat-containing protein [Prolixibacteraceae bacterium]